MSNCKHWNVMASYMDQHACIHAVYMYMHMYSTCCVYFVWIE